MIDEEDGKRTGGKFDGENVDEAPLINRLHARSAVIAQRSHSNAGYRLSEQEILAQ